MIHRSTAVALANLHAHAHAVRDGVVAIDGSALSEIASMRSLLDRNELDLHVLSKVPINPKLLGDASLWNKEDGHAPIMRRTRYLADYVSKAKMRTVASTCGHALRSLEERYDRLRDTSDQLHSDLGDLVTEVEHFDLAPTQATYEEASHAWERASVIIDLIEKRCRPDQHGWPATDRIDDAVIDELDGAASDLATMDRVSFQSLARMMADRNEILTRNLHLIQDISSLQSDFAELGAELGEVNTDFRSQKLDGFKHLTRLRRMLWAYGMTVIEGVHRQRYCTSAMRRMLTLRPFLH